MTVDDLSRDDLLYLLGRKTGELELQRRVIEAQAEQIRALQPVPPEETHGRQRRVHAGNGSNSRR